MLYIFILIFSLVGAVVLLFNRFQGGIYILTSGLLALLFASVSLAYQDQSAVLFILPPLALIASAIIGLAGYNKTKQPRADEQSISAGSQQKTGEEGVRHTSEEREQSAGKQKPKRKRIFIIAAVALVGVITIVAVLVVWARQQV